MLKVNGVAYKTVTEWIDDFNKRGYNLKPDTVRKRRLVSGIGTLIPPKSYIMTEEEFVRVLNTPLPMCGRVINPIVEDSEKGEKE